MTDEPQWISTSEAARLLNVCPETVRRWIDARDAFTASEVRRPFRHGGHRRVSRAGVQRILDDWANGT